MGFFFTAIPHLATGINQQCHRIQFSYGAIVEQEAVWWWLVVLQDMQGQYHQYQYLFNKDGPVTAIFTSIVLLFCIFFLVDYQLDKNPFALYYIALQLNRVPVHTSSSLHGELPSSHPLLFFCLDFYIITNVS